MALKFTLSRICGFVYSFAKLMLFFASFSSHAQWTQLGNKLSGSGNINPASQGQSVSISADGKTIVLGGFKDDSDNGAIWIYTFDGSGFVQLGNKLIGTGNLGAAQQGWSTSISADGKTIIVGGYRDNGNIGAAWVFTFNGTEFIQFGEKLTALDANGEAWQGYSVGISADGRTALVGGPNDNSSNGATWVYTFNGTRFIQTEGKLVGSGNIGPSGQGYSVSIASDAKTLITGGFKDNSNIGAAWIFTFNGSYFVQVGNKLTGNDNDGISSQGYAVDISSDGNTVVVGGPYDSNYNGSLWVYTFNGVSFIQVGNKLGGYSGAEKGVSVSISSDGKTIAAGGPIGNAVWVYAFNGTNFNQSGAQLSGSSNPPSASSYQGTSVDISSDGKSIVTGGPYNYANNGAAWIFTNNTIPCQIPTILGISNDINTCVGTSVNLSVDAKGSGLLSYDWYKDNLFLTTLYSPKYIFSSLTPSDIGNYICVISNNCGSFTTPGVNVFASPNIIGNVLPGPVCSGNTLTITGSGAPNLTITGGINLNEGFTALVSKSYKLSGVDAMGCSNSILINTTVNSTPLLKITGNKETCAGSLLPLRASGASTYNWSDGSVTSSILLFPTSSMGLSVTGFNSNCSITSLINITVNSLPDASLDLSSINNICDTLGSVILTGGNPSGGSYWYSGNLASQLDISKQGDYEIIYKYKGSSLCTNSVSGILISRNCTLTGICERPNPPCDCPGVKCFKVYPSFTPNGDGINDIWVIDTLPAENLVIILDTWGNEVFRAQPYLNNWNGTQNGKNLHQGIYYYFVQTGPEKKKYTGTVSIIR